MAERSPSPRHGTACANLARPRTRRPDRRLRAAGPYLSSGGVAGRRRLHLRTWTYCAVSVWAPTDLTLRTTLRDTPRGQRLLFAPDAGCNSAAATRLRLGSVSIRAPGWRVRDDVFLSKALIGRSGDGGCPLGARRWRESRCPPSRRGPQAFATSTVRRGPHRPIHAVVAARRSAAFSPRGDVPAGGGWDVEAAAFLRTGSDARADGHRLSADGEPSTRAAPASSAPTRP